MQPEALFRCIALDCALRPAVCIRRQIETAREMAGDLEPRSSRRKRGIGVTFPTCRGDLCAQGAAIRERFGDRGAATIRTGARNDWDEQAPRLQAWRRLGVAPTIDSALAAE